MSAGMQVCVQIVWPAAPTCFSFGCPPPLPMLSEQGKEGRYPVSVQRCPPGKEPPGILLGAQWLQPLLTGAAVGSVPGNQAEPLSLAEGSSLSVLARGLLIPVPVPAAVRASAGTPWGLLLCPRPHCPPVP